MGRISPWPDFESWMEEGIRKGYNKKNLTRLIFSEKKEERSWSIRGRKKRWTDKFQFTSSYNRWENEEDWKQYGLEMKYNKRNPTSLRQSEEERSWLYRGAHKKWVANFPFQRKFRKTSWRNFEEWKQYGLDKSYNERNPSSLSKSEDKEERGWYFKGSWTGWLKDFPLQKLRNNYISSKEQFKKFLEDPLAQEVAALALSSGNEEFDIEGILLDIFKDKFRDKKDLHDILEANKQEIANLVREGVTNLGIYLGGFSLDERKIVPLFLGEILSSLRVPAA